VLDFGPETATAFAAMVNGKRVEEADIILIDEAAVAQIERLLEACEHCAERAAVAFEYLLDALTGCDPELTEYLMYRPARCPSCATPLTEKSLVAL
jgi:hypothetical protein